MVRLNLGRNSQRVSVNFLCAAWLQKHVGLEAVAKALVIYQDAITDKFDPKTAYKSTEWLQALEPMKSPE